MNSPIAPAALVALALAAGGGASQHAEGGPAPAPSVAATGIAPGAVDGAQAHRLVAAGIRVVDVRTPEEFAEGHVPGALNIPHDEMPQRFAELGPPSTPLLVYCMSGYRSGIAIETLRAKGYTVIYDLKAYDRWVAAEPAPSAK